MTPPPSAVAGAVAPAPMATGVAFALAAGLLWGLVFVAPTMLAGYAPVLLTVGRYLAFGLVALPLALWDRRALRGLTRADWVEALKLAAVGNLLYYLCLSAAIQRAGGPLPTMIIGTLPVVIAVTANLQRGAARRRDGRLPWRRLALPLGCIVAGLGFVHADEWSHRAGTVDARHYAGGALLAVGALACWTWYPLRNAEWLRSHPDHNPRAWATAQGLATLPLAAVGYALYWGWHALRPALAGTAPLALPFGPDPLRFVALMLAMGLLASWLGTLCWNEASQRLPPALAGQLIVFETLAALAYAFAWRGQWPSLQTLAGIALLVAGVVAALRVRPVPAADGAAAAAAPG